MFARGETEEKMGAGFPLLECQQFLPRPKLPPPAQASAAHKIPEKVVDCPTQLTLYDLDLSVE